MGALAQQEVQVQQAQANKRSITTAATACLGGAVLLESVRGASLGMMSIALAAASVAWVLGLKDRRNTSLGL